MAQFALAFFILALVAALLGFGGLTIIAASAVSIAKIAFVVFIVAALILGLFNLSKRAG